MSKISLLPTILKHDLEAPFAAWTHHVPAGAACPEAILPTLTSLELLLSQLPPHVQQVSVCDRSPPSVTDSSLQYVLTDAFGEHGFLVVDLRSFSAALMNPVDLQRNACFYDCRDKAGQP